MAKKISDEQIKLSILIDGNQAQKELFDLEKSTRKLNETNKELGLQKKRLEKANKQETEEYKTLTKTIRENNATIKENKTKMAELQNQIGITGLTMKQLSDKAFHLKMALRNLVPGSEDFKKFDAELKQINERLAELKNNGKESGFSIGAMADRFNRFAALGASVIAGLTGVVLSIQKVIDYNGKLADAQTNVQKTTGMTRREVDELTKSFGLLKTRTGRIELLGIAEVGGRLGIAKEEIKDFVKVMDKSAVALGDSFEGGPEVVAEKLGRIKGLYDELKNSDVESSFESVGSALNDLGASGAASEDNMAEFVTRVGALPGALKPSIQQALGLAAAFEESGLKAEIAGNNYGKVISIAARDIGAFSTVLQRPRAELEKLINTDPTEFFFQFAGALKDLDATQLAQVLDYLKLNDNEVKMVLGAASANVDLFREKIDLAGQSMSDATSLTTEYDLKNNNLAATLERLKKKVVGWFTSDSVVAFLESAVNGLAKLIGAVEDSDGAMNMLRNTLVFTAKILSIVVASLLSYTAGAKLATLWSNNLGKATALSNIVFKVQYAMLVAQEIATKGLALAKALLSFNIGKVRLAYQALTVAMGINPFGALLAIIGAVVAAFIAFGNEADKSAEIIKAQSEVMKIVADQTAKTKSKIEELVAIMKDENASHRQKQEALTQLKKIGDGYLDNLTAENILTAEGTRLIDRYTKSIDQLARAKALVSVKSKLMEQQLENENKVLGLSLEKKANKNEGALGGGDDGLIFGLGSRNKKQIQLEIEEQQEAGELINHQLEAIDSQKNKEITKYQKIIANSNKKLQSLKKGSQQYNELVQDITAEQKALDILIGLQSSEPTESPLTKGLYIPDAAAEKAGKKAAKDAAKIHADRMKDIKKQLEDLQDLERQAIDDRLSLLEDGFDKEEVLENENHRRKLQDLKKQLISDSDIDSAMDKIENPKSSKQDVDYWTRQMNVWVEKNVHINNLVELEYAKHKFKLAAIEQKAAEKKINDLQDAYELESMARKTAHNYELAALGSDAVAKDELQKKFDKAELDRQKEHLEKLLGQKLDVLADKNTGIDLARLSPEDKKALEKDIADLKLKISEILKAKAELQGQNAKGDVKNALSGVFGGTDILGFTAADWEQTFSHLTTLSEKLAAMNMVVSGLQNIWGAYNNYVTASENAQLRNYERSSDAKKRKLKWQLDNGYINQSQYKKRLEQMDAELEVKKAEMEYRQAKRQKRMAIVDATINTARGVTAALGMLPPMSFIFAAMAAAAGALQIATIAKQPLPARGYEKGLYPEYVQREQDGKVFKSSYGGRTKSGMVNKPTYFLAGENGPEMIIDSKAYRDLSPETRYALERELRRIKGFEGGYYNDNITKPQYQVPAGQSTGTPTAVSNDQLYSIIANNTAVMQMLIDEGVIAYFNRDPRDLKKMMDEMEKITKSKSKAQN
ncbi:phage tail tape measure protein [Flavobacterium hauense]